VQSDNIVPAHGRGRAYYFLLDQKVTKNQVSRNASLPLPAAQAGLMALALQISQNHGLQNVALLRSLCPTLQQLLLCPCRSTWPPLFYLILPEAVLLTGEKKIF
jgi:hypothetical protein